MLVPSVGYSLVRITILATRHAAISLLRHYAIKTGSPRVFSYPPRYCAPSIERICFHRPLASSPVTAYCPQEMLLLFAAMV